MQALAERAYFFLCLGLGTLLRSVRYSKAQIVYENDERQVRKQRLFCAPPLIWMSGPLVTLLDAGVRVLPNRRWHDRERLMYEKLYNTLIRVEDGMLILPYLAGKTLAAVLDTDVEDSMRKSVIERAVVALADFHRLGFTHGDAMAENVMIDLAAGVARWFDFETIHDPSRPVEWRRADDVRALLVTCVARTIPEKRVATVALILDMYADEGVNRVLATNFGSILRRSLTFQLAQAGLSFQDFRAIARLLTERLG